MINNDYHAPVIFRNGHLQTIFPSFFRKIHEVNYIRERLELPDGDFLDLDWSRVGGRQLVILSHGLEGHTHRPYMRGMVRAVKSVHLDALAWNFRGCSGQPNRLARMYHNGTTDDLHAVVNYAIKIGSYEAVFLVGFSMGANLSLLYLGQHADEVPAAVKGAAVFSAPCDLADAAAALGKPVNSLYMKNFLASLHSKIKAKQHRFPDLLNDDGFHRIRNFKQFDDRYTAPIHGYSSAEDYWHRCSSKPWLTRIKVPALIVNARDDPFLDGACYPIDAYRRNPHVTLEVTRYGGHVGFVRLGCNGRYWSEERALHHILGILDKQAG